MSDSSTSGDTYPSTKSEPTQPTNNNNNNTTMAPRSPPQQQEAPKTQKRKGTRSVSTLTPSQLARKRANDREAQRAIRARTKEHIERLEREIEEMKSRNACDKTVQELLRKNKALEQEVMHLREALMQPGRPYPPARMYTTPQPTPQSTPQPSSAEQHKLTWPMRTAYEDNLSPATSGVSSRASSFGQHTSEYPAVPQYSGSPYIPTSEPCESWTSGLSYAPSVVSSPTSSVGADDYINGYIPTSVPPTMIDGNMTSQVSVPCLDNNPSKMGNGCNDPKIAENDPYSQAQQNSWMPQQHQQPWLMTPSYYPQSPAI